MLIPLRDENPTRRFPIVIVLIIAINVAVFAYEETRSTVRLPTYREGISVPVNGFDAFTAEWGFVPCELQSGCAQPDEGVLAAVNQPGYAYIVRVPEQPVWETLFTAMFIHGGWLHIAGNMLFLWIFGNNIEDVMGRPRFVVFYLVCGVAAALAQWLTDVGSNVPNIGASGAIAGVLGGYLLLYPRARVLSILFLVIFFTFIRVPAWVVLGLWFLLQLLEGSAGLAGQSGGVAYFAHVGGFLAGILLVRLFIAGRAPPPAARPAWY